jgi:hypothetical protein
MAKINRKKHEKCPFYEEKSLVRLNPFQSYLYNIAEKSFQNMILPLPLHTLIFHMFKE